jgi:hypothetical protein
MNDIKVIQEIDGKLYSLRPDFHGRICPFCGKQRKRPKDSRGHGFAVAGFSRHIDKCFVAALKAEGYKETRWDGDARQFLVEKIEAHRISG